ncbi:hypothetical protein QIG40_26685, partial [Klebsiella pneumoniae]|nr:hypothetical protein [Klebsiella pneumoniae]
MTSGIKVPLKRRCAGRLALSKRYVSRMLSRRAVRAMNGCRVLAWGKGQKASILSLQELSRRSGLLIIFMRLYGKA